ncbi:hypothetical protein [Streptosporangium carneum]|uniref:Secreted protein n=1 Tax=Streptosporangium carneum TaxID=47481 RepID=A0A9W6ICJ6_9ACTN|nr:hypothetical protein [Streptosporangium carneum]GLK15194.1 hypothetical protein GCM10017600_86070 [Streptosporangium carneum]
MRVRTLAAVAAATALFGVALPAEAASVSDQPFAEQARSAKLTTAQTTALQSKVDGYLKKVGGEQVALNEIGFPGGRLRVALPGEAHPRDFSSGDGTQFVTNPCSVMNNGWFCSFPQPGFQGDDLSWYTCGTYNMPWVGNGSWMNNQTVGTQARFYNNAGNLHDTTPGAYSSSLTYSWTPVFKVKPC